MKSCPKSPTLPEVQIGHKVEVDVKYMADAFEADAVAAPAFKANGDAFVYTALNAVKVYDVNRGTPFTLAVRFKRQASPAPILALPANQATDIAVLSAAYGTDTDLALLTTGTAPTGITVATSVTGATGEDVTVTYTFGPLARPDVYSITVKCDAVKATDGSPSVNTGDGCDKVYSFRIAAAPVAPALTYVSGTKGNGVDVTATAAVDPAMWHDTSEAFNAGTTGDTTDDWDAGADLVLKLTITLGSGQLLLGTQTATDAQILQVTSPSNTGSENAHITTGITLASAVASDKGSIIFTITFARKDSSGGGAVPRPYVLKLACGMLKDDQCESCWQRTTACTRATLSVSIHSMCR